MFRELQLFHSGISLENYSFSVVIALGDRNDKVLSRMMASRLIKYQSSGSDSSFLGTVLMFCRQLPPTFTMPASAKETPFTEQNLTRGCSHSINYKRTQSRVSVAVCYPIRTHPKSMNRYHYNMISLFIQFRRAQFFGCFRVVIVMHCAFSRNDGV